MYVCYKLSSTISEKKSCGLIFEIMLQSTLKQRLDTSDEFYDIFNARDISLKNKLNYAKVSQ